MEDERTQGALSMPASQMITQTLQDLCKANSGNNIIANGSTIGHQTTVEGKILKPVPGTKRRKRSMELLEYMNNSKVGKGSSGS